MIRRVCVQSRGGDPPWREPYVEGSLSENPEWRALAGGRYGFLEDFEVEAGMALAVEVKAAHEDRMFIVFGPQVIVEESGPRILTPDAMDVIEL